MSTCVNIFGVSVAVLCLHAVTSLTYCHSGSYYIPLQDGHHACELCEPGTFMPHHDHQVTQCYDCMRIADPMLEILVSQCTSKEDSYIHCVRGYYRRLPRNPREKEICEKCTECSQHHLYTVRKCQTYTDTHCCAGENYAVVKNKDGVDVCQELPWLCRRGHYFDTSSFDCKPCPAGTFMSSDYHMMAECTKCLETSALYLPLHSVVLQHCNQTHQDVLGCKDGYFLDSTKSGLHSYVGCSPCTKCEDDEMFKGRRCSQDRDTVCCRQPNMKVVDNPDGVTCQESTTVSTTVVRTHSTTVKSPVVFHCSEGLCDCIKLNRSVMCLPCELLDQFNHTQTFNTSDTKPLKVNGHTGHPQKISWTAESFITGIITGGAMVVLAIVIYKIPRTNRALRHCTAWLTNITVRSYPRHSEKRYTPVDVKDEEIEDLTSEKPPKGITVCSSKDETSSSATRASHKKVPGRKQPMDKDKHKLEMGDVDSRDMRQHYKKNPGLPNVLSLHDFFKKQLSLDKSVSDFIRASADLTVRLEVKRKSNVFLKLRGFHNFTSLGTGMVCDVTRKFTEKDGNVCPCWMCTHSHGKKKKRQWGEFKVMTAKYVVYDDCESVHTQCTLFYDEITDKGSTLQGVSVDDSNLISDIRIMSCVTHDKIVSITLEKMVKRHRDLRDQLEQKFGHLDKKTCVIICHPYGLEKRISVGEINRSHTDDSHELTYTAETTCPGLTGSPVFVLGDWKERSEVKTCALIYSECTHKHNESGRETLSSSSETLQEQQAPYLSLSFWNDITPRGNESTLKSVYENQGCQEMEFFIHDDCELYGRRLFCKKNPEHSQQLLVGRFHLSCLPGNWRQELVLDFIKVSADLTVRLEVNCTSSERPAGYPLHQLRGDYSVTRLGTGMVYDVSRNFTEKDIQTCPCRRCSHAPHKDKKRQWGELKVVTSRHLVYDYKESVNTTCTLLFDDGNDKRKCVTLQSVEMGETLNSNLCILSCITHDQDVFNKLKKMVERHRDLRDQLEKKNGYLDKKTCVVISHPHGLEKRISVGKINRILTDDLHKLIYSAETTCTGSTGAPVFVLGDWKERSELKTCAFIHDKCKQEYNKAIKMN